MPKSTTDRDGTREPSRIIALVPARAGSKRLPGKNTRLFKGKPMLVHGVEKLLRCKLISEVYVSTEAEHIGRIATEAGAKWLQRPLHLAEDHVPSQAVFKHAASVLDFDILVSAQANSPTVKLESIEAGIQLLLEHNLREVRSVSSDGLENGAFWIMTRDTIFWDGLSVYFGVIVDDAVDIHTHEDLQLALQQAERNTLKS